MSDLFDTPWKIALHLERVANLPRARLAFMLAGVPWGTSWKVFGQPILQRHRRSKIQIGARLTLRSSPRSNPLSPPYPVVLSTRAADAAILIGDDCGLTGTRIVAEDQISIGSRVLLGAGVTIVDTDFHPLTPEGRAKNINAGRRAPVYIEDDVFVGMNALILKGVRLGSGCVVGAGAVVSNDVPPGAIVAGNPAKLVGTARSSRGYTEIPQ